jgi:hypothetical protein
MKATNPTVTTVPVVCLIAALFSGGRLLGIHS